MNELPSAREFFLPPEKIQYVDVIQQSQGGALLLWHTVPNQPQRIANSKDHYLVEITALGDNAKAVSKKFRISREGEVFALTPHDD